MLNNDQCEVYTHQAINHTWPTLNNCFSEFGMVLQSGLVFQELFRYELSKVENIYNNTRSTKMTLEFSYY